MSFLLLSRPDSASPRDMASTDSVVDQSLLSGHSSLMHKWSVRSLGLAMMVGTWIASSAAHAQCCAGYTLATACADVALTKSRWCIQSNVPSGQNALPKAFCSYGDQVVSTLEQLFGIPARGIFEFELDSQTGGAHTGTACANVGIGVAYDGFTGTGFGATGFWGYLLSLHEAINVWTGMSSGGWPTDWWADHQSAFPNMMDFHVMNTIGTSNGDQNLITAAAAQKKRFYPAGSSPDPKVVALDNVFAAMPGGDGYAGFSRLFSLHTSDGVQWDNLGVANPNVLRSEYVVAYMSLAAGQPVLALLQGPGDQGGGNICNGTPDGTAADMPYTCSAERIDAIANAHCAIAANGKKSADLTALRAGKYTNIASGPCGSTCPAECGCDENDRCTAPWLAKLHSSDAGTFDAGHDITVGGPVIYPSDGGPHASSDAGGRTSVDAGASTGGSPAEDSNASDAGCGCRTLGMKHELGGFLASWAAACALLVRNRRRSRKR